MKKLFLLLAPLLLAGIGPLGADEGQSYTYRGEIAGVVCSACSKKVKAAFTKMEGVKEVKITPASEPGVAKLEIVCTKPDLSKETAAKALGSSAEFYPIKSLKKD